MLRLDTLPGIERLQIGDYMHEIATEEATGVGETIETVAPTGLHRIGFGPISAFGDWKTSNAFARVFETIRDSGVAGTFLLTLETGITNSVTMIVSKVTAGVQVGSHVMATAELQNGGAYVETRP